MKSRYDAPLIAGKCVYGNPGLGVTGAVIRATTATGTHGPGLLYNDWDSGADDAKEFRALIVSPPSSGTLFVFEDGSFTFNGAPDGAYTLTYRLFVDGVDLGVAPPTTFVIGTGISTSTGTLAATEGPDIFLAVSTNVKVITGVLAATESAGDTFAGVGYGPLTFSVPAERIVFVTRDSERRTVQDQRVAPGSRLDYAFNWDAWLSAGEVILSYTVAISGPATVYVSSLAGGAVVVWVEIASDARIGYNVALDCTIVTDTAPGRVDSRRLDLTVLVG